MSQLLAHGWGNQYVFVSFLFFFFVAFLVHPGDSTRNIKNCFLVYSVWFMKDGEEKKVIKAGC